MNDEHVGDENVVVVRGTVSSEPTRRELPSGDVVTHVDVTTRVDGRVISVPVAVHRADVPVAEGDRVVVTGIVSRRFFRSGGQTRARTEVVAADVIPARRVRTARRAVDRHLAPLTAASRATGSPIAGGGVA